jgi:hypothetical protein
MSRSRFATSSQPLPHGTEPPLPPANPLIRSETVLAKEETTGGPAHACYPGQRSGNVRNRTEGIGDDDRVDGMIWEGDVLSGRLQELDRKRRAMGLLSSESPHLLGWIERPQMPDQTAVVEGQVQAGPETDFEN